MTRLDPRLEPLEDALAHHFGTKSHLPHNEAYQYKEGALDTIEFVFRLLRNKALQTEDIKQVLNAFGEKVGNLQTPEEAPLVLPPRPKMDGGE